MLTEQLFDFLAASPSCYHAVQALSDRLGKTGCAIAAVTDPGLAKVFVSALAQADPEQYSNTAAELAAQTRTDTGTAPTGGGRNGKRRKRV